MRLQTNPEHILRGVVKKNERFDFTMCNPPFFDSMEERISRFGRGISHSESEECTPGGEITFLHRYARESVHFSDRIGWFSSMTGKKSSALNLRTYLQEMLEKKSVVVLSEIGESQTKRWIVAWRFL